MTTPEKTIRSGSMAKTTVAKPMAGSGSSRYGRYLYIIVPLLLTVITFSGTLNDALTNWDDDVYVTNNQLIRSLSPANIVTIFSPSSLVCSNYHPLTVLSLAVNYAFGRLDPRGYIATNILLHLLNTLLVFFLIRSLSKSDLVASVSAVLFGIHPMHVESVAWVTGRKDLLYTLFYLSAMLGYIRYLHQTGRGRGVAFGIVAVLFVLSLLSKTSAVTLPLVLLLLDYWYKRRFSAKLLLEKLPFVLIAAILGVIAIKGQQSSDSLDFKYVLPVLNHISLGCYSFMFYIVKLLAPVNLSADYPYPLYMKSALPLSYTLTPLFAIATGVIVFLLRRSKVVVFGFLFFLSNVVFILHFFPVGATITADRFSYLSYIGLFFPLAYGVKKAISARFLNNVPVYCAVIGIIAALGFAAHRRCEVWKDSISLWTDVLSYHPNFTGFYGFGSALMQAGKADDAVVNFRKALAINPKDAKAHTGLGDGLIKTGRVDEGISQYRKALNLNLNYSTALNDLGCALLKTGKTDEAIAQFQKAVETKPDDFLGYYNLGSAYLQTGKSEQAIGYFQRALEIKPANDSANNNIGNALLRLGRSSEAIGYLEKARAINPDNWGTLGNLANAYMMIGRVSDAIACLDRASSIQPANLAILNDLTNAYLQNGQVDKAIAATRKALILARQSGQEGLAGEIEQGIRQMQAMRNGPGGYRP